MACLGFKYFNTGLPVGKVLSMLLEIIHTITSIHAHTQNFPGWTHIHKHTHTFQTGPDRHVNHKYLHMYSFPPASPAPPTPHIASLSPFPLEPAQTVTWYCVWKCDEHHLSPTHLKASVSTSGWASLHVSVQDCKLVILNEHVRRVGKCW